MLFLLLSMSLLLFAGQQWALKNKQTNKQQGSSLLQSQEQEEQGTQSGKNIEKLRKINLLHGSILQTHDTPDGQRSTETKNQKYNLKKLENVNMQKEVLDTSASCFCFVFLLP